MGETRKIICKMTEPVKKIMAPDYKNMLSDYLLNDASVFYDPTYSCILKVTYILPGREEKIIYEKKRSFDDYIQCQLITLDLNDSNYYICSTENYPNFLDVNTHDKECIMRKDFAEICGDKLKYLSFLYNKFDVCTWEGVFDTINKIGGVTKLENFLRSCNSSGNVIIDCSGNNPIKNNYNSYAFANSSITSIKLSSNNNDIKLCGNCDYMFSGCSNLQSVECNIPIDPSTMAHMFSYNNQLEYIHFNNNVVINNSGQGVNLDYFLYDNNFSNKELKINYSYNYDISIMPSSMNYAFYNAAIGYAPGFTINMEILPSYKCYGAFHNMISSYYAGRRLDITVTNVRYDNWDFTNSKSTSTGWIGDFSGFNIDEKQPFNQLTYNTIISGNDVSAIKAQFVDRFFLSLSQATYDANNTSTRTLTLPNEKIFEYLVNKHSLNIQKNNGKYNIDYK